MLSSRALKTDAAAILVLEDLIASPPIGSLLPQALASGKAIGGA
jgi:hypothetical protein